MSEPTNPKGSNTALFLVLGLIGLCFLIFGTHGCLRYTMGLGGLNMHLDNWGWRFVGPFAGMFSLWGVWALLSLVLAVWVGSDANRRGMNGLLWGLLVFFTSVVGLLIYLIVAESRNGGVRATGPPPAASPIAAAAPAPGPPPPPSGASPGVDAAAEPRPAPAAPPVDCSTCGTALRPEFKVCPNCGTSVPGRCARCGRGLEAAWKVCPYCGTGV
jgi:predicted RNA-binding Zn-ribbon protein involved in translation (DUF1610 family)